MAEKRSTGGNPWEKEGDQASRAWGVLLFAFIGAAATTLAVGQLRKTAEWFYTQLNRSQTSSSWRSGTSNSSHWSFKEAAWKRYNQRMQEMYEEEMERVERIRRMQSVFNRERNKYKRSYENWRDYGPGAYQHYQRDDWYWQTDTSYRDQGTNYQSTPRDSGNYSMSHHYNALGLDRSRAKPYTDAEIKVEKYRRKDTEFGTQRALTSITRTNPADWWIVDQMWMRRGHCGPYSQSNNKLLPLREEPEHILPYTHKD